MTVTITEAKYAPEEPGEVAKMVLRFPREFKIKLLKDLSKDHNFGQWIPITKILLEAPCSEAGGGISTEVIDAIWQEHNGVGNYTPKQMKEQDDIAVKQMMGG